MLEWQDEIRKQLAGLNLEPAREIEIIEELAQHLDDRYREFQAAGFKKDQARAAAIRELAEGGLLAPLLSRIERSRGSESFISAAPIGSHLFALLSHNVRYSIRRITKGPGFAAVVVLAMALGIGANTAIFSVVNALLLRPLPIKAEDRLVYALDMRENFDPFGSTFADAVAFKNDARSIENIGVGQTHEFRMLTGRGPERISGAMISHSYLTTLGGVWRSGRKK